jgi:hypothetical protein
MSRVPDPALRSQWQRRLLKFQAFHGSLRQFCHDEGVSVASFYQWRGKLDVVRHSSKKKSRTVAPLSNTALRSNAAGDSKEATHFVPLQLVQETTRHTPAMATIVLPGGTRIELSSDDSPVLHAVIRSVMHEDAKLPNKRREFAVDDAGGIR